MPPSLHDVLEDALTYIPAALDEPFSGHPLGDLLVREGPEAMASVVDGAGYKLQGSRGRGRWAETVWLSVYDRFVTETAQRGYYLVYLFRRDGGGLFLARPGSHSRPHRGRRPPLLGGAARPATVYAGLLKGEGLDGLQVGPIDLGGGGMLTRGYEAGNVAAVYYDANSIPRDAELHRDLRRFLGLYRRLIEANDHLA